jgi:hypothetical protein
MTTRSLVQELVGETCGWRSNLGAEPIGITFALTVDTDFADLFAVKEV